MLNARLVHPKSTTTDEESGNQMRAFQARVAPLTISTFIAMIGCHAEPSASEHCYYAAGDQTCSELFGTDRPYCVAVQDGCEDAEQFQGCVASPPADECYSPCGGSAPTTDDSSCLGSAEDETTTDTSTDDGDEDSETGDGDGDQPPACGNGVIEADEACDDGNSIDDDECSNSCGLAACGDGILQEWTGETCDDGNTLSGDACAATCVLPGTIIWSRLIEGDSCPDAAVALADNGNIHVASDCANAGRSVTVFDESGDEIWNTSTPLSTESVPSIALVAEDRTVIGGRIGTQGQARLYDATGAYVWSTIVPLPSSMFTDVAVDESDGIVAVGWESNNAIMYHYSADGELEWFYDNLGAGGIRSVASNPGGAIWALRDHHVLSYATGGDAMWTSVSLPGDYPRHLAIDHEDRVHVVGWSNYDQEGFVVTKLASDGTVEWIQLHDQPAIFESGEAIAALPNGGGVLVAGWTNDDGVNEERDGLLSWYASDGSHLRDAIFDGPGNNDPDQLQDVAISSDGYAVAVGSHQLPDNVRHLWILKVAI